MKLVPVHFYFYRDRLEIPFFCFSFCQPCGANGLTYFPDGKHEKLLSTECSGCGRETMVFSSPIVTAN